MTVTDNIESYRHEVARRIHAALKSGASDLTSILRQCDGADPVLVQEICQQESPAGLPAGAATSHIRLDPADPRLSLCLPAPDPATSQWWFTSSATESLSELVEARVSLFSNPRVFCLGAPSIGHYLAYRGNVVDVLDIDPDVVDALKPLPLSAVRVCMMRPNRYRTDFWIMQVLPCWTPLVSVRDAPTFPLSCIGGHRGGGRSDTHSSATVDPPRH